jgi:G protein-coupled receptor GPR1
MIVWIFPFVSHVMDYDHSVTGHEPRWLLVVGIISLCVQGAVDCALFMVREEPWRHAKGRDQFGWLWDRSSGGRRRTAGRTREEMLVDGRLARLRRDGEILEERAIRGSVGRRKAVTEWWEADPEFLDGSLDEEERGSIHGEVNGVVGRTVD